jgi:hypothetical protein
MIDKYDNGDNIAGGPGRVNVRRELERDTGIPHGLQLNDVDVDPSDVRAIMINEAVPPDPEQDFYGSPDSEYSRSAASLFRKAGFRVDGSQDILRLGVYLTNAVKVPKSANAIEKSAMEASLPYLEQEVSLFPEAVTIMLMGDVARKAFNTIAKRSTGRNVVPAAPTCKIRGSDIRYGGARVMPSYIMTGANPAIERSKPMMIAEDIAGMMESVS